MKKMKIGFLAILAIITMSFTIASNQKVNTKSALLGENDCFLPIIEVKKTSCQSTSEFLTSSTTCTAAGALINSCVWSLNVNAFIPQTDVDQQCPAPQNVFCCAFLTPTENPCCPSQPKFDLDGNGPGSAKFYRISSIRCRS